MSVAESPRLLTSFCLMVELADLHGAMVSSPDAPIFEHTLPEGFVIQFNGSNFRKISYDGKPMDPLFTIVYHNGWPFSAFGPCDGAQIKTADATEEQFIAALRRAIDARKAVAA